MSKFKSQILISSIVDYSYQNFINLFFMANLLILISESTLFSITKFTSKIKL